MTVNLEPANADGLELIKELRMTAPDVPVLAITMKRGADRRDRALWAGEVLTMAAPEEIVDVAKRTVGE